MKRFALLLLALFPLYGAASGLAPYSVAYDPERDPFADLEAAAEMARIQDKKILLEIGGDWCRWCHILDRYLAGSPEVRQRLLDTFVLMKVNVSEDNPNDAFLARLPEFTGVPHFVVLDTAGKVLGQQNTSMLEEGESYSDKAFLAFIRRWQ